jgi:hypothetical protein
MSKARVFFSIVLFLGFSALLLFGGQLYTSDDSSPNARPGVYIPPAYQATPSSPELGEISLLAGISKYFTPQDDNTSCTVMYIINPTATNANVTIAGYNLTGATLLTTTFAVPKKNMVRICSDGVTTISQTWQNVILVNFTGNISHAKITYPSTLKITAYVAWNGASDFDPMVAVPTLPITLY